jgi:hypothetical protein
MLILVLLKKSLLEEFLWCLVGTVVVPSWES